jgi:hypothetical protein
MYEILPRTFKQAKKIDVVVKPSRYVKYKIDIFDKEGKYLYSGGDPKYSDYSHYIQTHGKEFADERKRLYANRHRNETLRGKVIKFLLWE